VVHAGLAKFFAESDVMAPDAAARLRHALEVAMRASRPRAALAQWWMARLERIADWLVEAERERVAAGGRPEARALEQAGEWKLPGDFLLKGRADRIERDTDGGVRIIDYKTGKPPEENKVKAGTAPQLPLEAVMAELGAFGEAFASPVKELIYVALSGRASAGAEIKILEKPDELRTVIERAAGVGSMLKKFADASQPFLAAPHPRRVNRFDDYAGISRRAEWGGEGEDVSD
jgi:ATP-dependent helicase/nuclease subunit B